MHRIFVVASVLLAASPAAADWQYTRWGMTPQQVIAASRGAAKPDSSERSVENYRILLAAPYAAGRHQFTAHFIFTNDNRLTRVRLTMRGGDCQQLRFDLGSQYGDSVRGIPGRWRDERRRNNLAFVDWGGGHCVVEYWSFDGSGGKL